MNMLSRCLFKAAVIGAIAYPAFAQASTFEPAPNDAFEVRSQDIIRKPACPAGMVSTLLLVPIALVGREGVAIQRAWPLTLDQDGQWSVGYAYLSSGSDELEIADRTKGSLMAAVKCVTNAASYLERRPTSGAPANNTMHVGIGWKDHAGLAGNASNAGNE